MGPKEKEAFIRNTCKGELQAILLVVLRSPVISYKFREVFEAIGQSPDVKSVALLALILAVLGKQYDLNALSELLNIDVFARVSAVKSGPIREIRDFKGPDVRLKSPVVARELLRQGDDGAGLVQIIVDVIRRLNSLSVRPKSC